MKLSVYTLNGIVSSQNKEVVFSALLLKLSVIEQLHQEGELICQLEEYCKWADLIENW